MAADWRRVIAALVNDDQRLVWARLVTGAGVADACAGIAPARAARVLDGLRGAGLLDAEGRPVASVFAEALAAAPRTPQPTGPERYLRDGRIDRYPANHDERAQLLRLVGSRAFEAGAEYTERDVNERLEPFHPDVAVLRRYLVDFGVLERTRSGSAYALAAG